MNKIIKYARPYLALILLLAVFVAAQVWADLELPGYMAKIVNEGIVNENQDFILTSGGKMLLVSLFGGASTIMATFMATKIAIGFAKDLRADFFKHVESFSLTEFTKFSTSSLITRSTNDIQQIQTTLSSYLRISFWAPMLGVGAVIQAYAAAPSISWIMMLAVTLIFMIMITVFIFAIPKFKTLQKLTDKINRVAREYLSGLRVIRAFNTESHEENRFNLVNIDLTKTNLFVNRIMVVLQPIMMLIFNVTTVAIIWFGSHLLDTDELLIGDMLAFLQYAMQVIMAFLILSMLFIMIPRASVSINRISEVLSTDPQIKDPKNPTNLPKDIKGIVSFENVSFTYAEADEPVIENITFTANPGEVTAFIGSTGSGKSTIINLIPRFFDATEGKVMIDGIDIKTLRQSDLRKIIGYTPQKAILFSGDIKGNIKYGLPEANDDKMLESVRIAQAKEFIEDLPEKYDSSTAQGGLNFSGGQKQRISIARALLKDPDIYIFDDTFSALDFKTDALLRRELEKTTKDKTVIIVAQRVGTIMDADKIVVLDKGKIIAQGKHDDLLGSCQVYKEIAESQLSKADLDKTI